MTLHLGARDRALLAGTGAAFPSELGAGVALTNAEVYRLLLGRAADTELAARGWDPDHVRDVWGVERREWVVAGPSGGSVLGELAALAGDRALADAGLRATDVDLLLTATSTPEHITSALAAAVGRQLGVTAPCLDVRAGGTGGLAAWLMATRMLADDCRTALVVAAETPSRYVRADDLSTALLYGDGAGALVLRSTVDRGCVAGLVGAVLGRADAPGRPFTVPGALPPTAQDLAADTYRFQTPDATYLDGLASGWAALCEQLRVAVPAATIADHFLPYAVTAEQVRAAASALGVAPQRTFDTLARHGCLGCPGPLVALDTLRREHKAAAGELVALAAVAGGVSMAGMVWRL